MKRITSGIILAISIILICVAAYFSGLKSEDRRLRQYGEHAAGAMEEQDKEEDIFTAKEAVSHKDCFQAVAREHEEYEEDNCVAYAYEGDFDGDGKQEAFVIIGRADEETDETVFGNLLFIQDQYTIETLESVVFFQKDQTYIEEGTPDLFHVSYIDGINRKNKIYNIQEGEKEEPVPEYAEKEIVGEEFIPSEDLLERIQRARADQVMVNSSALEYWHHNIRSVGYLDVTEHFTVYGLAWGMLMVTDQGQYIYGDFAYYHTWPKFEESDLDGDGDLELAVFVFEQHGTGFHVEDLYVADETKDGWKIYRLLMSEYKPVLEEHFGTVTEDGTVRFSFDGEKVGLPYEIPPEGVDYSYHYEIGSQVEFFATPDGRIILDTVVDGKSEITPIGFGPGHGLQAEVWRENGEWKISNVNYRDSGIDYLLGQEVPAWFAGVEEGKRVSYIESSYPAQQVESGKVKAEVKAWLEGEEWPVTLNVWVIYEEDEEREGWFIQKIERAEG